MLVEDSRRDSIGEIGLAALRRRRRRRRRLRRTANGTIKRRVRRESEKKREREGDGPLNFSAIWPIQYISDIRPEAGPAKMAL